jgi:tetratricopeptide (TPR) repeat protein
VRQAWHAINFLLLAFLLYVTGCAGDLSQGDHHSGYLSKPSNWIRLARAHVKEGDLQQALYEYRVAYTLSGHDVAIKQEIVEIQNRIVKETDALGKLARKAIGQNKIDRAQKLYLKLLSLNPRNKEALVALRAIDESITKQSLYAKRLSKQLSRKLPPSDQIYRDEDYVYSRKSILQADNRAKNVEDFIKELQAHIAKYPRDEEVKEVLLKTRLEQAKFAFEQHNFDTSVYHLEQAEKILAGNTKTLNAILDIRKRFAKDLYIKGVRQIRDDVEGSVKLWKQALKFHPQDRKIKMRIQSSEQ